MVNQRDNYNWNAPFAWVTAYLDEIDLITPPGGVDQKNRRLFMVTAMATEKLIQLTLWH